MRTYPEILVYQRDEAGALSVMSVLSSNTPGDTVREFVTRMWANGLLGPNDEFETRTGDVK